MGGLAFDASGSSAQFAHDELQEQQGGFGGLFIVGKVAENAALFLAAKRRVGENHVHPFAVANFLERKTQRVAGVNVG